MKTIAARPVGIGLGLVLIAAVASAVDVPKTIAGKPYSITASSKPGTYVVAITFAGLERQARQIDVPLGGVAEVNATQRLATVAETVQVVGRTAPLIATGTVGANLQKHVIDALATPRTLSGIASLAPGLTANGPASASLPTA